MQIVNKKGKLFLEIVGAIVFAFVFYQLLFWNRIYPGVKVAGVSLSGKTIPQAQVKLESSINPPDSLNLKAHDFTYQLSLSEIELSFGFQESASLAYSVRRPGLAFFREENLPLAYRVDEQKLEEKIASISASLAVPAVQPEVEIVKGKVEVSPGSDGQEVETRKLKEEIISAFSFARWSEVKIPIREVSSRLAQEEVEKLAGRAALLVGKKLSLKFEFENFVYTDADLVGLLDPQGNFDKLEIAKISAEATDSVNRDPQNAIFVFEGGRVKEFKPAKDGIKVKEEELASLVLTNLEKLLGEEKSANIQIPAQAAKPQISLDQVNNLGIKELVGRGSSTFRGSIPGRVHNIGLAASRISGTLVGPGETFSFNQVLGDVSLYTGYKQAFIIKDGRTVLGDGGGVCQVSSNLFRALLNAGLPIVQRHQHSYRVSYYEQDSKPGFDATIYSPSVDLKFKNDTPGHILIQGIFNPKTSSLVFEIYGTSDGRAATVSNHRIWDIRPAPPALYQDDPTLPVGKVKQVDFAAGGAKAAFDYKVERDGQTIFEKTFYSNYRPWQAVFLRGTGPTQ